MAYKYDHVRKKTRNFFSGSDDKESVQRKVL